MIFFLCYRWGAVKFSIQIFYIIDSYLFCKLTVDVRTYPVQKDNSLKENNILKN